MQMVRVEGSRPDLMVQAGKASMPGPTAVPTIKATAAQKLFWGLLGWWWEEVSGGKGRGLRLQDETVRCNGALAMLMVVGCKRECRRGVRVLLRRSGRWQ